ncbi:MAG: thioredoxin-dependent thiol peroxidase [Brevundimonas sp.]|uniref:thioredoxin-dependent thiol peroxidase n=1 Tax=Brevundimonas sp. TaxID=1871086 RepID=UPI00391ADB34
MTEIIEGAPAPEFDMATDGGGRITLGGLKGQWAVLFFYPKADTPGCTSESKDFSAMKTAFGRVNAVVVGVSKDPVKKLDRFKDKHELNVTLASDDGGDVCERYGVWGEKTLYGRKFMGIERTTFLIDPEGQVRRIWRKVKVPGHAQAVLDAVNAT